MSVLPYKRGDLEPASILTLYNADGSVLDLTNALSAKLIAKQVISSSTPATINASLSFVDRANGKVKYTPASPDHDTVGVFNFETQVIWPGSPTRPQTVPNGGNSANIYDTLLITQDLGD